MARLMARLSTLSLIGAAALMAAAASAPARADDGLGLTMNQAKIVKLARDADTIIIGNPEIADAAVQDPRTVVLTGKGFGITNLVVLDRDGNPVIDRQISVSRQTADSVRVYRRANIQTLSCTPYCESSFKSDAERTSEAAMNASQ